ncbi:hypothetical protein A4G18_07875 [Pasteurellaceae bacterium Pebbles2]|nr:hypothetical protein [Pasteurellaceae bacterium Pebbles2]
MDLNTILIILGILALIGLVAHGIWANRREKSQYFNNEKAFQREPMSEPVQATRNVPDFAQPAPPIASVAPAPTQEPAQEYVAPAPTNVVSSTPVQDVRPTETVEQIKITLPNAEVSAQDEPVYYEYVPEPKQPSPNMAERTLSEVAEYAQTEEGIDMSSQQLRVQLQDGVAAKEPVMSTATSITVSPISAPTLQEPVETRASAPVEPKQPEPEAKEFMVLYVVAPENRQFQGVALAQALDNLGFIVGRDDLYHRHIDTIASPIIFSVADINQPGTFNPYAMHDFFTIGVALFMPIPSAIGNNKANLRMMIQAAKNLAAELNGFVLNDQQELFDENAEQAYLLRV